MLIFIDRSIEIILSVTDAAPVETVSKTARTIKHGARFSRKLQRRITRRTLAEARALKEQGTECIHVLLYVAELVSELFPYGKKILAIISSNTFFAIKYWKFANKVLDPIFTNTFFHKG